MSLADALSMDSKNQTYTENGALTYSTTMNKCLDFFFQAPVSTSLAAALNLFEAAFKEDPQTATKLAFWVRCPRQGAGMRDLGRLCLAKAAELRTDLNKDEFVREAVLHGRWDDLMHLFDVGLFNQAANLWMTAIAVQDRLAAKWAPREKSANKFSAIRLATFLGLSRKEYRKFLARNSSTIETLMCAKQWDQIKFSHVPSQAMKKLSRSFQKNQPDRFGLYLNSVAKGTEKINTSTLWPHQILGKTITQNFNEWRDKVEADETTTLLWENQKNWISENSTLVVADTSASMGGLPIQVCLSLALYTAERLQEPWRNRFITFSEKASFVNLNPNHTLAEKIKSIPHIVSDTNLESVFTLILETALAHNLTQDDMPQQVLIISDMEFNCAQEGHTNYEVIQEKYKQAGYIKPNVIFWNVASRSTDNCPVTINEDGVALISGYSPIILKSLGQGSVTPQNIMLDALKSFKSC